jgi:DNA-binding Lrp family transcriptional regulator
VHALLSENPDLSLREAAKRLGISAPSVHLARRRLAAEGLLPKR